MNDIDWELPSKTFYNDLLNIISESIVYQENVKLLPTPKMLMYLLIKSRFYVSFSDQAYDPITDNIRATEGRHSCGIVGVSIDDFLRETLERSFTENKVLTTLSETINSRESELIYKVSSITKSHIDTYKDVLKDIIDNYWTCKIDGKLNEYMLLSNVISDILLLKSNYCDKALDIATEYIDLLKETAANNKIYKLAVNSPKDLTLIIDLSLQNNQKKIKYTLFALNNRIVLYNLLTDNEVKYLFILGNNYQQMNRSKEYDKTTGKIKIPHRSVLLEKQVSNAALARNSTRNNSYANAAQNNLRLSTIIGNSKKKNAEEVKYLYIIGTRIRKHLNYPGKNFVILSKKGSSTITNINLILDESTSEERFKYFY